MDLIKPFCFMEKMAELMSNPEFREFFNKYFNDWSDTKAALMMMKTYAFVDEQYTKQTGLKLPADEIIVIVRKMIMNSDYRLLLVNEMNNFMAKKGKFLEYYQNAIENSSIEKDSEDYQKDILANKLKIT